MRAKSTFGLTDKYFKNAYAALVASSGFVPEYNSSNIHKCLFVTSQPSINAGVTTEPSYTSGGGLAGTDLSVPYILAEAPEFKDI